MVDINNLEAWARSEGYDPDKDYSASTELPPGHLSPHFTKAEFACNCCGKLHPDGDKPPQKLLDWLEDIRAHFGKSVNINSGYRCPVHNANVGGASSSRHMAGDASDLWIEGVSPAEVYAYADKLVGDEGGVGKYDTFTHIDARGYKARW